ncbi:PDZ domain-containing protein [Thermodesulfobacteriota bacterium]
MKLAKILLPLLFLAGCATNPFSQFYFDQTGGADITTLPALVLSEGDPQVYRGNNVDADSQVMLERGYSMVGYSSFNARNATEKQAIAHGRSVHAETIIVYSEYTNTVSGTVPLTLPDTQTSTTNVYGNVYGSGGYGTYSGTGTTTTYGTKTMYIPYNVRRYDYLATYWVKLKPPVFGAHVRDVNNEERQEIGSNKGVMIVAVINDSPAFLEDILKGDILKRIGSVEIIDSSSFQKALELHQGDSVQVEFIRNGQPKSTSITLRSRQ